MTVTGGDTASVAVTLRNSGPVPGAEVVQVYVAPAPSAVRRPVRELAAFRKVYLEPGEEITVEVDLGRRAFAFWDAPASRWWVEPGTYQIQIGRSSADVISSIDVELAGDTARPRPLSLQSTVAEWFAHPVAGAALMNAMMANATPEQLAAADDNANMLRMVDSMPMGQFARFPGVQIPDEALQQLIAISAPDPEAA